MDTIDDLLNIRDLGLAAALNCEGIKPAGTRQGEDGRVYFMFLRTDDTQIIVDKYWAYLLAVDARNYAESLKAVKSQIYNERGPR